jgi:hypothetical protein
MYAHSAALCLRVSFSRRSLALRPPQEQLDGTESPVLGLGALGRAQADQTQGLLMDVLWSDPTANDGVLGVNPNRTRGGATLTFGPDRVLKPEIVVAYWTWICHGFENNYIDSRVWWSRF